MLITAAQAERREIFLPWQTSVNNQLTGLREALAWGCKTATNKVESWRTSAKLVASVTWGRGC